MFQTALRVRLAIDSQRVLLHISYTTYIKNGIACCLLQRQKRGGEAAIVDAAHQRDWATAHYARAHEQHGTWHAAHSQ